MSVPSVCRLMRRTRAFDLTSLGIVFLFVAGSFVSRAAENDKPVSAQDKKVDFEPGVLAGQVFARGGSPVADAKVFLRGGIPRSTRTDKDGRFRIEFLPPAQYRIWATKGKLVTQEETFTGQRVAGFVKARFAPLRLMMGPGKVLKVTVTSAKTKKPLEGARVRSNFPTQTQQTTANDGTATIEGLLPQTYTFGVQAPGHAALAREVDLSGSESEVKLAVSLLAGGVIRGTVIDEKGRPLSGASVYVREQGNYQAMPGQSPRTDAHGKFSYEGAPVGTSLQVSVDRRGYLRQEQDVALPSDRPEMELKFRLMPQRHGGSITGVVSDEHGKPVVGATLENSGNQGERQTTKTDEKGRYVLRDLLESYRGYAIQVRAPGHAPRVEEVKPGPADKPARVDFTLEPGHFIHGRVIGEDGKPIAGVSIYHSSNNMFWSASDSTQTDESGRFEIDSLPADAKFQISKTGYDNLSNVSLKLDAAGTTTVILPPMAIIRGRVVDAETHKPLTHFNVRLGFSRERYPSDVNGGINSTLINPGKTFDTKDGTFTIKQLTNRMALQVAVEAEGYLRGVLPRIVVAPTDEAKLAEVSLRRFDPSTLATVSGRVLDHAGRPVPGAILRLIVSSKRPNGVNDWEFNWWRIKNGQLEGESQCDQFLKDVSDHEGRFEFKQVLPARYWQLAYWGVHVPQGRLLGTSLTRPAALETVTVNLPQPCRITGTVDRAKHPDVGSVSAWLRGSDDQYQSHLNEGQSEFEFNDLPPGDYQVHLQSQPVRVKNQQYFTINTLATEHVSLKGGATKKLHF